MALRTLFALTMIMACVVVRLSAQGGATGAISGTVEDSTGAVIPGATVKVVSAATGDVVRTETTDSAGLFTATLLPVHTYKVQVSAPGFAETVFRDVTVRVTETTRMRAILQVKAVAQRVEVSAQIEKVQTANATTGESIGAGTIGGLPLATRNFQQLLALSTGGSSNLNASAALGRGDVRINVNGGREDNNNYQIEGITASDYTIGELTNTPVPSADAVQEFKVSTSLYDATQGRNGGGNINAILKGGTADFHFDVFEYFRNTSLDANDFFLNKGNQPRPVIQQNIFGGSAGGPVGGKGKWGYFFANYQGTRQRSGESPGNIIGAIIPALPADRSAPSLSQAYFGNTTTTIDPVALKLLNFKSNQFGGAGGGWLIPSLPADPAISSPGNPQARLNISRPGKFTDNQFTADWDREFRGGKDRLSERFFYSNAEALEPFGADSFGIQTGGVPFENNLNFPLQIPVRDRFGSLIETHVFSPRLVNEFRFGANVISNKFNNVPTVTAQDVGIIRPTNNGTPDIYRFTFGTFQIGSFPNQPQTSLEDNFIYLDTLSYIRGPHSFRFGGEVDHVDIRRQLPVADNGLLFFTPPLPPFTDFQNFLLGSPTFGDGGGGDGRHDYRINAYALFAQDDYRVTRDLTLNLGLRSEILGAPYDNRTHIGNTDPALVLSTGQPFFFPREVNRFNIPGLVGTANRTTLDNNYATVWEPRVGLAYDVLGHHTTSIRAGYGRYSVREDLGAVDNLSFTPPFFPTAVPVAPGPGSLATLFSVGVGTIPPIGVVSPAFVPHASIFQGFVNGSGQPTADTTQTPVFSGNVINFFGLQVPRKWVVPTTQQWNFTVQRSLVAGWVLEAGYIGTKGTHLRETSDRDQAILVSPQNPITLTAPNGTKYVITQNTAANANARAPYPGLSPSGFEAFVPDANSIYHSLQVTVSHRFSKGLYFQSGYAFSRSIDDTSTASVAFDTRFNDEITPRSSRGLSDFDRTHRWTMSYVYSLPFLSGARSFAAHALQGWELSGILTLQSGTPFTVIDSSGGSAFAESSPNLVTPQLAPGATYATALTSGSVQSRLNHYLNVSAFIPAPVVGSDGSTGFGNVGRNTYRGPSQKNLDFSLGKNFRISERQQLRFTADFFNLTNTPSFASPANVDIESPATFGAITSTVGTPRLIQFSLRYSF